MSDPRLPVSEAVRDATQEAAQAAVKRLVQSLTNAEMPVGVIATAASMLFALALKGVARDTIELAIIQAIDSMYREYADRLPT